MPQLRAIALLCLAIVAAGPAIAHQQPHIVADADTGVILSEDHADEFHAPASLTKVMTLYLAFRAIDDGRLSFDQELTISKAAARQPAVKLGLKAGGTITVKDTILAIVTRSANDAAVVLAEALGGTESAFARTMTLKARELGMSKTTFRNASGLPNKGQLSSARDMLTLAQAMLNDFPHYYHLFSTLSTTYNGRTYRNTNRLVGKYKGLDGLKTGYTRASGFNLAASAERGGKRLIVIVLGHKTAAKRNSKVASLFNQGFRAVEHLGATGASAAAGPIPKPHGRPDTDNADATIPASAPSPSLKPEAFLRVPDERDRNSYETVRISVSAALAKLPGFVAAAQVAILPSTLWPGSIF